MPEPVLLDEVEQSARRMLAEVVTGCCRALGVAKESVAQRVEAGDAAEVLLGAAVDADLLVLGNRRRGALAGALTGSVALRCAHYAACPVVLVPVPAEPVH